MRDCRNISELEKIETMPFHFPLRAKHSFFPSTMLTFQTNSSHLVVSGNTFPIKYVLHSVGGTWDATSKTWRLPVAIDNAVFRISLTHCEMLSGKEPGAKEGPFDLGGWTLRAKKMAMLGVMAKKTMDTLDTDFWWICCERCTVTDWHRQRAICPCHR